MKLLPLYVYRNGKDCSNNGVSKFSDEVYIPHPEGFIDSGKVDQKLIFKPVSVDANYHKLVPYFDTGKWCMFGGNLATTSDSRGSKYVYKIHDRFEN